jgi:hypothetical protein
MVFGFLMSNLPLFAADTNLWNVQVAGLRVITPSTDIKNNFNGALMAPPGVAVEVRLTPPYGKVVNINQNASKVDSITDDKGTDLLAVGTDNPFNKPGFGIMDGSKGAYATADIQAAGLPAKGATILNISGKVVLEIATGTNLFSVDNVEMKTNSTFTIGDLPVMISDAGTNRNAWSAKEYKYSVTFSSMRAMENISNLEFFDSNGNKIDAVKRSWGGGGFLGYMMQFDLKQNVERAKIVATCWQGLQTIEVPISVKTGLGL